MPSAATAPTPRRPRAIRMSPAEIQAAATLQSEMDAWEKDSRAAIAWAVRFERVDKWLELGIPVEDFHPSTKEFAASFAGSPPGAGTVDAMAAAGGVELARRGLEIGLSTAWEHSISVPTGLFAYTLRRSRLRVDLARANLDGDTIKAGDVARELAEIEEAGKIPGGCSSARSPFDIPDPSTLLIGDRLDTTPPQPDWLLNNLLKRGGVALVCGPGGVGKSTLLLSLSISVAGQSNRALAWDVTTGGRVLFVTVEDDFDEVHRRAFYTTRGLGPGYYEKMRVKEQLYIVPRSGDVRMVVESPNGPVLTQAWNDFCSLVRNISPTLVILDPQSRIYGCREIDEVAAHFFYGQLEALGRETGAAIIISHHTNKASSGADQLPDRLKVEGIRGTTAFVNAVRTALICAPLTGKEARQIIGDKEAKDGQYLVVKEAKNNHGPSGEEHYYKRGECGALEAVSRTERTGELEKLESLKSRIIEMVGKITKEGQAVTAKAFTDANAAALKDELGAYASKAHIRDAITGAIQDGSLVEDVRPNGSGKPTSYLNRVTV